MKIENITNEIIFRSTILFIKINKFNLYSSEKACSYLI
ncbi:hypothetical protein YN1HA_29170 [Sulfurisphaera ohwakuensis]